MRTMLPGVKSGKVCTDSLCREKNHLPEFIRWEYLCDFVNFLKLDQYCCVCFLPRSPCPITEKDGCVMFHSHYAMLNVKRFEY